VEYAEVRIDRLRIYFRDGSFLDVWFSRSIPGKYAFHYERRHLDGRVYRWDNAAHSRVKGIPTFPHHFHNGSQSNVQPYMPKESVEETFHDILNWIKARILEQKT